jgi:protein phosphatase 1L
MLQASGSSFAPPGFTKGQSTVHDSKLVSSASTPASLNSSANNTPIKTAVSVRSSPAAASVSAAQLSKSPPPKATSTPVAAAAAAATAAASVSPRAATVSPRAAAVSPRTAVATPVKAATTPRAVVESVQDIDADDTAETATVERIQDTTFIVEALDDDDIAGATNPKSGNASQSLGDNDDDEEEVVEAAMAEVVNMYAGDEEAESRSPSRSSSVYDSDEAGSEANDSDVEPGGRHPPPDVSDSGLVPAMDAESIASVLRSVSTTDIVQSPSERFTVGYAETQGVRRTMEDRMTVYGRYMGCFPECDHQILTADGFLSLGDVERRVAAGADLLVASYDAKHDALVYERPLRLVVNEALGDATELVEFLLADGTALVTTPNHQMFVRAHGASTFVKASAAQVLAHDIAAHPLDMLTGASAGVQLYNNNNTTTTMDTESLQRIAVPELYGLWLATRAASCDAARAAKLVAERERAADVTLAQLAPTVEQWRSLAVLGGADALAAVVRGVALLLDAARTGVLSGIEDAGVRDELVQLLMCAGCASVRFEADVCGRWSIAYATATTHQRVVRVARVAAGGDSVYAQSRTWCFTMPSGFVVARRVLSTSVCAKTRRTMVTSAAAATIQGNCADADYFGMFDGHGGDETAHYVGETLHTTIFEHIKTQAKTGSDDARVNFAMALDDPPTLKQALFNACEALQKGLETRTPPLQGGAVSVVALVIGEQLIVANSGDARCVLVNNDGTSVRLSVDHKPHLPEEKARIEKEGGFVTSHTSRDGVITSRVCGAIAVSRAFGDVGLQPFLIATPHISELTSIAGRAGIILACDGLWDVLSDADAAAVMLAAPDPEKAARRLRNKAYSGGSTDNISCLVVKFRSE